MKASRVLNYAPLVTEIAKVHQQAQSGAAGAVNRHLLLRNWLIGAYLVEFEQNGQDRARYGAGLLKRLSGDLRCRDVEGVSPDMLERMRIFYLAYPQFRGHISATASRKLSLEPRASKSGPISASPMRKSPGRRPAPLALADRVALPRLEQLQRLIEGDRAAWEQRREGQGGL